MKQKFFTLLVLASFVLFSGCYPDGVDDTEDYDIVYSAYDKEYSFQDATTYALPDQIVILDDRDEEIDFIDDAYATPILAQIDDQLQALGWTKVANEDNPDVQILPASWTTTTISYWGGGYWCYWDPYYCDGGWYYPYPIVSSYTTGTFVWVMVDNTSLSIDGNKRVVWTAALNGLFQGGYDPSRINKGINQAFKQSPYLKTN